MTLREAKRGSAESQCGEGFEQFSVTKCPGQACVTKAIFLRPKTLPKPLPNRPKTVLGPASHRKRRFPRNHRKTNRKSIKMPSGDLPKTIQNRPKSLPRGKLFPLKFQLRFGIDFGAILVAKMLPFGHPRASKILPETSLFGSKKGLKIS